MAEICVVAVDVVAATAFGDHASTGRMNLIADPHWQTGLITSVRLRTGGCMGMGIGIWNGVDIKLFDGLRECEMA